MLIDAIFIGIMLLAIYKGLRNGLVIAVFSVVGWAIGLFAAWKFSSIAAIYLKSYVNPRWLSILSFIAVFLLVMVLVRLGARLIEKIVEISMLGWVNRLGGLVFYVFLYAFIFSVVLAFAEKVQLLNGEAAASSRVYPWLKPLAHLPQLSFLH